MLKLRFTAGQLVAALLTAVLFVVVVPFGIVEAQQVDKFNPFLVKAITWVSRIAGILIGFALITFIWGMAKFIGNAGDEGKRKEGKQLMVWGVIALAVIVSIWGLTNYLRDVFGVSNTTTVKPPRLQ